MKKVKQKMMVVISVIVIGSLFFIGKGWAQTLGDAEAEKISLQKRASETEKPSELTSDDFLNIINEAFSKDGDSQRSKRASFSTDSDDLKPLLGTTWIMGYKIVSVFADVLTFGTQVSKDSDGVVSLSFSDQLNTKGAVFYSRNLPQSLGGQGFIATISTSTAVSFYTFTINGSMPKGVYALKNVSTGKYSDDYSLTGMKWGSDIGSSNCVSIGNNLSLGVSCATYNGNKYGFVLNNVSSSADPFGYYWKLDLNTFTAK